MSDDAEKLRALARQSRSLSRQTTDRNRAGALEGLALVYERQAEELELGLNPPHGPEQDTLVLCPKLVAGAPAKNLCGHPLL